MPRIPHTSPQTLRLFMALLADPQRWRYGYDLSKETALASGTLYPILMRLTEQQLLETKWEPSEEPGRPARHIYRLSADGAALAEQRLAAKPAPEASRARTRRTGPIVQTRTADGVA
jgi:DNA-binding PadR family transcriptional regulator